MTQNEPISDDVKFTKLQPTSPEYIKVMRPYNEAASSGTPIFVAQPKTPGEVMEVIQYCLRHQYKVSVHATGHDFEGRSLSGHVVLHVGELKHAKYDPVAEILTVGGGALVYDVYQALAPFERAISTGTNLDVGITGLALGGGAAYTSRMHGLTCDLLLEVDICTFDGQRLTVNDQSNPAMMRVLRGGGGGRFGVITELKFKTYEAKPVTIFSASWDFSVGAEHLAELEKKLISAPRELSMRLGANVTGKDCVKTITLSGQLQGAQESVLKQHFGALMDTPTWTQSTVPYYDAMAKARHQTSGGSFKIKSRFAVKPMGREGLGAILNHLHSWTPTSNTDGAGFGLFAWGGRVRDFPEAHSCMPSRAAEYLASFDTSWTVEESPEQVLEQLQWVSELDAAAAPYLTEHAYVNFPDSDLGLYNQRHLAPFLHEIQALESTFDPSKLSHQESRCVHLPNAMEVA